MASCRASRPCSPSGSERATWNAGSPNGSISRSPTSSAAGRCFTLSAGTSSATKSASRSAWAFEGSFEDFPTDDNFDLILSLDSWYHIGRDRSILQKTLGLRARGGRLLIQLMNHDRQLYWVLDQVRGLISSNELSTWAREQGLLHDYFECSRWIPASRLLPDGHPTEGYMHFVAFAKGRPWDGVAESERDQAIEAVTLLQRDGSIETRHGYLLFG